MTVSTNSQPPSEKAQKATGGHDYKTPGIIRAGFQYQDLVAIEILINFYRQRDIYAWVQLDAEERAFRSVEDVVACRPDGLYELTQVKFTADPDTLSNSLSWAWLTKNGGVRKKSLLQKWAETTLSHKEAGSLARAALKTDRVPDSAFAKCLEGTKVEYTRLSAADKAKFEEQLGSIEAVKSFFESFEFIHSQLRLDDLEEQLWSRVASDTDRGGWALFREQVQRWSTRKREPAPDGKIKYIHLRQAFSVERSKPMPQSFLVPSTYSVPDAEFDRAFFKEITTSDGLNVLWGPPGRGKSTYLSHCIAGIDQKSAVCIRHHYFLSLDDRSEGRFHYHAIARSLEHQLEQAIPDLQRSRKGFGDLLETVALQLESEGRRLIVVIDGLDHVWRDHRDHEDMEVLFNALLPLPRNVRLVVGTQKIANEYLPARLLKVLPAEHWTELPLMSQAAVHRWLRFQDKADRLNLEVLKRRRRAQVVRAVAKAFYDISQGLPLHLIYSFEAVVRSGKAVKVDDIAALPSCPTGDIRDYYRSLWNRIGPTAQTILHVLAGLEFGPPPFAMHDCFGRSNESLSALTEINHLLDYQETGVRPFHGSVFAFVRGLPEHRLTFCQHASGILAWLETCAPEYWHWAWLWITKAQLGNPSDLRAGPNREWAISSLVAGFPIEQLITILDHAEKATFDAFDLPHLLRLRLLKTRAVNGPELQSYKWPLFQEVAISLSEDPHILARLRTSLHRVSVELLPFIVRSADESFRAELTKNAIDELKQRIVRLQHDYNGIRSEYQELAHAFVAVLPFDRSRGAQRVMAYAKRFEAAEAEALIATYVRECLLSSSFDDIFEVGKHWSRHDLDRAMLAALCIEGLNPSTKPDLKALVHPAIGCLAVLKGGTAKKPPTKKDLSHLFVQDENLGPEFIHDARAVVYEVFFTALSTGLSGGQAQGWSKIPSDSQDTWLSEAIRALERLADYIAEKWKMERSWPTLQEVYSMFRLNPPKSHSYKAQRPFIAIRLALRDIAVDLCTIAKGLDVNALISVSDIQYVPKSSYWLDELWLDSFAERRLPLHTSEAAQEVVERVGIDLDTRITEFNDRMEDAIKLAVFAFDNGLIPLAKKELRRAVGCLLSYGWRKDPFASEVLESLDLLAKKGDVDAQKAILDLAGEFEALTDCTDGSETGHTREEYYKVVTTHFPERVPRCYAHLIRNEDWHYAEALAVAFAETDQVESHTGSALLESYIIPPELRALEETSVTRPPTMSALASIQQKTGRHIEATSEQKDTTYAGKQNTAVDKSELKATEVSTPNPRDFPPKQLQEFLFAVRDVRSYDLKQNLVSDWLRFWETAGCGKEVLTNLEALTTETKYYIDLDNALDVAFEIALRTQGRAKAFPLLIRAHITRHGWQRWFTSSDEAQARMRAVALHYREQWREFIRKTAKPVYSTRIEGNGIVIGLSRVVFFLVEVGELDLARTYALEMAKVFKEEMTEQPIETPEWSR